MVIFATRMGPTGGEPLCGDICSGTAAEDNSYMPLYNLF